MSEWTEEEIKGKILHKLTRMGKFIHSHTAVENLQKGFPSDLRGKAKEMIKELRKEGILIIKPTSYGEQVSINLEMNEKIIYYISIFLDKKD
jgi:hypothetical protein